MQQMQQRAEKRGEGGGNQTQTFCQERETVWLPNGGLSSLLSSSIDQFFYSIATTTKTDTQVTKKYNFYATLPVCQRAIFMTDKLHFNNGNDDHVANTSERSF